MKILGIETSCDDTSFGLYDTDSGVLAQLTANQLIHDKYGGVVPEIASRQHVRNLLPIYETLLADTGLDPGKIDGIGVSNGPGLVGSLLVGVGFAKALAMGLDKPLAGVHHIEAHILSNELEGDPLKSRALVLVVSGGHTALYRVEKVGRYELLGNTRDDAAGECFDKIAKLLGLGYPGGPLLEAVSREGNPDAVEFPRAMMTRGNFDFSFSGLKTAVRLHVESPGFDPSQVADTAASAQEAIVDALVRKTLLCARHHHIPHVYLAGGVAANGVLRARLAEACAQADMTYHAPLLEYCTDNGAMVAGAASRHLASGRDDRFTLDVFARGRVTSWA